MYSSVLNGLNMKLLSFFFFVLFAVTVNPAFSQTYPTKPVRLVVGFPPGGSVDIVARLLGQYLGEALGKQFIVDNRSGAHGIIGADIVSKATPDGYTLLVTSGGHSINPSLYKKLPYDTLADFATLSCIARYPLILLTHPSLPAKSVKELIALSRARSGQLNYASTGLGSPSHLAMELFLQATETKITHIPYKGGASALVDLTAGHVSVMFNNILVGLPLVRRGQLRVLGVSSASRSEAAPDIPTISEAGVPNFGNTTWTGVLAPSGINRNLISSLHKKIISALRIPAVRQRLKNDGAEIVGNTPEQFYAQIESELSKWRVVAQAAGIEPQ